jgi:hypothetical protein
VVPMPEQASVALRYGRDITGLVVSETAPPPHQLIAVGAGPAGAADAPNALRPTTGRLPDDARAPGAEAVWTPEPVLRTPGAAVTAGAALQARAAAGARRLRAGCVLLPAVRPGDVVEIQDLPDTAAEGRWLLTAVEHRLDPPSTHLEAVDAGAGSSLLGSLIAAVGNLL